jgi:hypothetical protein
MKVLGKATLTLGLMIIVSLFLTSCSGVVTPEISMVNSNNPNSNNYQNPSTDPVEKPATEKVETEDPQKWPGLTGFCAWYDRVYDYGDIWLENGFSEIRYIPNYLNTGEMNGSKAAVLEANIKGLKFIWGVGSGGTTITASNWPNFRQAILDAAQWAQDNGVYEFQIGNEEEFHVDGTTMTVAQIITNLKSVATEVKEIFTNGNVSYSCSHGSIDNWIAAGKGDLDILAANIYLGGDGWYPSDYWKTNINKLIDAFGVDGTYISEFAPSSSSLDDYSTDEEVQAAAVTKMIDYMKASGIKRALYYSWKGDFGVVKNDETYRLLWSQALLNTGPIKFATVPTKATIIPVPDTIALIPNNPNSTTNQTSGSSVTSTL